MSTPAVMAMVDQINAAGNKLAHACELWARVWNADEKDGDDLAVMTAGLRMLLADFDGAMDDLAQVTGLPRP